MRTPDQPRSGVLHVQGDPMRCFSGPPPEGTSGLTERRHLLSVPRPRRRPVADECLERGSRTARYFSSHGSGGTALLDYGVASS